MYFNYFHLIWTTYFKLPHVDNAATIHCYYVCWHEKSCKKKGKPFKKRLYGACHDLITSRTRLWHLVLMQPDLSDKTVQCPDWLPKWEPYEETGLGTQCHKPTGTSLFFKICLPPIYLCPQVPLCNIHKFNLDKKQRKKCVWIILIRSFSLLKSHQTTQLITFVHMEICKSISILSFLLAFQRN